jgi:cell wall-associated NlpC family hydrolase
MSILPVHRRLRQYRLALILVLAAMPWLVAQRAHANPDPHGDAVARFLAERGLLEQAQADGTTDAAVAAAEAPAHRGLLGQVRDRASEMVMTAMNFLGVPYRRGGNNAEEGFDCSGFTRHVFELTLGLVLPRRADEQASAPGFVSVAREELKPGDLVFFNTLRRTFSHVGIYIGDGKFIHSPRTGASVRIEDMRAAYWKKRFTGARRPGPALAAATGAPAASQPAPAPARDAFADANLH